MDDGVGILYENEIPIEVITDRPSLVDGPAAYRMNKENGEISEVRLSAGLLN